MKKVKNHAQKIVLLIITVLCFTSCFTSKPVKVIPRAINTVNTVALSELNLERQNYRILNTVTAEATIICEFSSGKVVIKDETGEFELHYTIADNVWTYNKHEGVMKLGYLARDYSDTNGGLLYPEEIARRAAIYRLINTTQQNGADGIIEPTISTNIEQVNKKTIVYKSTVTGKVVKLKTDN